jgi:hypothetical protein
MRCGDSLPGAGAENGAGLGGVGGDEVEQAGDRTQVVVDSPNWHRFAEVAGV